MPILVKEMKRLLEGGRCNPLACSSASSASSEPGSDTGTDEMVWCQHLNYIIQTEVDHGYDNVLPQYHSKGQTFIY